MSDRLSSSVFISLIVFGEFSHSILFMIGVTVFIPCLLCSSIQLVFGRLSSVFIHLIKVLKVSTLVFIQFIALGGLFSSVFVHLVVLVRLLLQCSFS